LNPDLIKADLRRLLKSEKSAADTNPANSRQNYTQHKFLPDICACFRYSAAGAAHKVWRLVNNAPKFPA
jgi:hypothetical protein